jgi:lactoylglutathione lyase
MMLRRFAVVALTTLLCVGAGGAQPTGRFVLDHVGLLVTDLTRSAAFYEDVLGLQEIPAQYKGTRWLAAGDGRAIHLIPGRTQKVTDTETHFSLATTDLAPVLEALKAHHVTWFDGSDVPGAVSHVRLDGVAQIYLKDPDGYVIEINDSMRSQNR